MSQCPKVFTLPGSVHKLNFPAERTFDTSKIRALNSSWILLLPFFAHKQVERRQIKVRWKVLTLAHPTVGSDFEIQPLSADLISSKAATKQEINLQKSPKKFSSFHEISANFSLTD